MEKYPKIDSVFKRDERGKFIVGDWATPEINYLQDASWEWTEKIDGTNIRVIWDAERITFEGKTDNAQIPTILYKKLQDLFPKEKFDNLPALCLYGEGYGKGIQKAGKNYNSDGVDFILFDIRIDGWWLNLQNIEDIASKLEIRAVPLVGTGTLWEAINVVSNGRKSIFGDFIAEGLVMKPRVELHNRKGERIITKVKYKDFHKEET